MAKVESVTEYTEIIPTHRPSSCPRGMPSASPTNCYFCSVGASWTWSGIVSSHFMKICVIVLCYIYLWNKWRSKRLLPVKAGRCDWSLDRVKEECSIGRVGKQTANAKSPYPVFILSLIWLYVREIWYLYTIANIWHLLIRLSCCALSLPPASHLSFCIRRCSLHTVSRSGALLLLGLRSG